MRIFNNLLAISLLLVSPVVNAAPDTGREAAAKYFQKGGRQQTKIPRARQSTPTNPYSQQIGLSVGTFFETQSYKWMGQDINGWAMQLDYRPETTPGSYISTGYRLGFQKFQSLQQELSKVSFLWSVIFPARVTFPVYVGLAGGPGFFLKQREDESWLTVEYQGFLGMRLNGDHSQFFLEGGIKNHALVLSNGQFSGWFVSSGVAYKF